MLIGAGRGPTPQPVRAGRTADHARILACFAGLETSSGLLLAVSGGPDSMALLLMAARWRESLGAAAPALHVATVDHGLRAEGRAEAETVGSVAADLDLPHAVLTWAGRKPSTRVQERARAARYALLADHARALGTRHILTAHHADDQAETILLRLGRGSGIAGLGGMRRTTPLAPGIDLVRPFLGLAKTDLVAICRSEACAYGDDPSNHSPAFTRTRLRAYRDVLAHVGLDTPALLRLARRMARADSAIEAETDRVAAALAPELGRQSYRADLSKTQRPELEIALRLLGRGIAHVAGDRAVRLERLETLAEAVQRAVDRGEEHRGTIAGTRVLLDKNGLLTIVPEAPRQRGQPRPAAEASHRHPRCGTLAVKAVLTRGRRFSWQ